MRRNLKKIATWLIDFPFITRRLNYRQRKENLVEVVLTEREKDVLSLLSYGLTNKEISNKLHISIHTTKAHLESIYLKLEVQNRLQAVVKAVFIGILDIKEILIAKV